MKGRLLEVTYEEFINNILETRGRNGCGEEYHETHHIVPKCMGGSNDKENLIDLFAREHFEAHRLLALENPEECGLQFAWWNMCQCPGSSKKRDDVTPEEYEEARIAKVKAMSGQNHPMYGKHLDEDTKNKISKSKIGKKLSDSSRKAISIGHIGIFSGDKHPMYGKHHSEETKQKISVAVSGNNNGNFGKAMSNEQKEKISNTKKNKYKKEKHPMYGKHHTEESRKKNSDSHKGLQTGVNNPNAKYVIQFDKMNNLIKVWKYLKLASSELNIQRTDISSCCSGRLKTAGGGYQWKYLYDQTRRDGTVIQGAISLGLITEEEALKQLAEQESLKGEN